MESDLLVSSLRTYVANLESEIEQMEKGNKRSIIGSLNQQIVFNRNKRPSYAKKMVTTRNIVTKKLKNK